MNDPYEWHNTICRGHFLRKNGYKKAKENMENIKVISIVGRFLEHSRIYRFGTKEREKVYVGSADFMTRNTIRRVEVAVPILDQQVRDRLEYVFEMMMSDDEKGKELTSKGLYVSRNLSEAKMDSQELFYAMAYSQAEKNTVKK